MGKDTHEHDKQVTTGWYDDMPSIQQSAGDVLANDINAGVVANEVLLRLPADKSRLYTRDELLKAANWAARAAISWAEGDVMDWPLRLRSSAALADGADTWLPDENYQPKPLFEGEQ